MQGTVYIRREIVQVTQADVRDPMCGVLVILRVLDHNEPFIPEGVRGISVRERSPQTSSFSRSLPDCWLR